MRNIKFATFPALVSAIARWPPVITEVTISHKNHEGNDPSNRMSPNLLLLLDIHSCDNENDARWASEDILLCIVTDHIAFVRSYVIFGKLFSL